MGVRTLTKGIHVPTAPPMFRGEIFVELKNIMNYATGRGTSLIILKTWVDAETADSNDGEVLLVFIYC